MKLPPLPRNMHLWLGGYIKNRFEGRGHPARVWVTLADHFEPLWQGADEATARRRVRHWRERWPDIAGRHHDSAGRSPRYTFFYPAEKYRPFLLDPLAEMSESGIADVEVHLHHGGEGERYFVECLQGFIEALVVRHGLLRKHGEKIAFGFIHGNWALDNSRPDGQHCGLNNEIQLLRDLGCYADFTLPSAPSLTQTSIVNTIYWATDDPQRPKSHNTGVPVTEGGPVAGDLLMIPGPLGLNWRTRRVENGELEADNPPTEQRASLWYRLAPRIGEDAFLKLFTHGAQEANLDLLLGGGLDLAFDALHRECETHGSELYFVSAYEMWQAVEAVRQRRAPLEALRGVPARPQITQPGIES